MLLSADLLPPGGALQRRAPPRDAQRATVGAQRAIADAERENESRVAEFYTRDELLAGECVARPPPHGLLCLRVEALPPPTGDAAEARARRAPSSPRSAGCAARRRAFRSNAAAVAHARASMR